MKINEESTELTKEEQSPDSEYASALATKLSQRLDGLLEIAESYREKYDNAKTSLAREVYKKKLFKSVSQIDFYMQLVQGAKGDD